MQMHWPTAEMMMSACAPATGYRYEVLRQDTIAELIAALGAWQPGWSVGAASVYLRESYYMSSVFLEGGPQQNVFTMLIRQGDELAGMLSQERSAEALSLYASLVVLSPAHRGGKALFQGDYLEALAKLMGLEFIYTLVTLKHRAAQRYFEGHGYQLVGFMPGYDREEVSPGVVKRVVEAAYVKCLAKGDAILSPDVSNMTSTVRRLYEFLHESTPPPSAP
jgi:hypothetical protein